MIIFRNLRLKPRVLMKDLIELVPDVRPMKLGF